MIVIWGVSFDYRSRCRWAWSLWIGPGGCAERPVHGGNWEPWGRSHPPGCPGYKEEADHRFLGPTCTQIPAKDTRVQLKLLWRIKNALKLNLLPCPINFYSMCIYVFVFPAMSSTVYNFLNPEYSFNVKQANSSDAHTQLCCG